MSEDYPYLFTVTDRFAIADRFIIVVPGIPSTGTPLVRKGDPLILRTPSGEIIKTIVQSLELVSLTLGKSTEGTIPVLLPPTLRKSDIPIGTEVFLDQVENGN